MPGDLQRQTNQIIGQPRSIVEPGGRSDILEKARKAYELEKIGSRMNLVSRNQNIKEGSRGVARQVLYLD